MPILEQAMRLGLSAEQAAQMAAAARRPAEPPLEIMPENWPAFRVFAAAGTQWRRAGMTGVPTGLDYAVLPAVAGMLGIPADEALLARVQLLEGAALTAMLERASGTTLERQH